MNSNIEERVVEMQFDNKKFEKNARDTMKTLDALEKSLDLKGASKSFEDLDRSIKKVDTSHLSDAIDAVTNKFSLFGTIGDQILRNLTDRFADMAVNWAKSMTIGQLQSGWSKYEAKTQAVQVIMHSTGKSIEDVNDVLQDLTQYTDDTSYRFDQMVDAIGKFSGVSDRPLEDLEKAVEGIANWAAVSGVNANDAGRAFFNLSQAMSVGSMTNKDWVSIEGLQMSNNEFKEKAIEVAQTMIDEGRASAEMAAAFKKAKPNVNNFKDSLSTGWLDKDVMVETFLAYADRTTEFGHSAYMAAYEAKSLTDAVDAAKEAVASGWANIFEQIFGNYEEAKVFWTEVADAMISVFSAPTTALAELLTEWHGDGGYVAFIDSIRNAWEGVLGIGEAVSAVFDKIFPKVSSKKLVEATEHLQSLTESFKAYTTKIDMDTVLLKPKDIAKIEKAGGDLTEYYESVERVEKYNAHIDDNLKLFTETLEGIFSILNLVRVVSGALLKIALPFTKLLTPIAKIVGVITAALGRLSTKIADAIINSEWFTNIVEKANKFAEAAAKYLSDLGDKLATFLDEFTRMPWFEQFVSLLTTAWNAIKEFAGPYVEQAGKAISEFIESVQNYIDAHASEAMVAAGEALTSFGIAAFNTGKSIIEWLIPAFQTVWAELKNVWQWLKTVGGSISTFWKEKVVPTELYRDVVSSLQKIIERVRTFGETFIKILKEGGIRKAFAWLMEQIDGLFIKLKKIDYKAVFGSILSSSILLKVLSFILTLRKLRKALGAAREFLVTFPKSIKSFTKGLAAKRLAMSILIIAGALWILEKIDPARLWELVGVLGAIGGGLVLFTVLLAVAMKAINKDATWKETAAFSKAISSILALAVAVGILAVALKIIAMIPAKRLGDSIFALLAILGALALTSVILSTGGNSLFKAGVGMLALVAAVLLFVFAFEKIREVLTELQNDWKTISQVGVIILGIFAGLAAVLAIMPDAKKAAWELAAVILSIGAAMLLISLAMTMVAKLDDSAYGKAALVLLGLTGALVVIILLTKVLKDAAPKQLLSMAGVIVAIGVAVALLSASMVALGIIPKALMENGLKRLAIIIGLLSAAMLAAGAVKPGAGKTFLGMSLFIGAVVTALLIISRQDIGKLYSSAVFLGLVVSALALSLSVAAKISKESNWATLLGLGAVLLAIAGALWVLSEFGNANKMISAAAAIGIVLVNLGLSMLIGGKALSKVHFSSLLGLMGVVVGVGLSLLLISQMPLLRMVGAAVTLSVLMLVLAGVSRSMSKGFDTSGRAGWDGALQSVVVMFGVIGFITAALWVLQSYGLDRLIVTGAVLTVLMVVLTGCAKALSRSPSGSWKSARPIIAMFGAILFPIAAALAFAKFMIQDPSGLVDIAKAIGAICLAMMIPLAAIMALSAFGAGGVMGIKSALSFGAIIAIVAAAVVGIGALASLISDSKLDSYLNKAESVLARVGSAIGGLIGGLISGIGDGIFGNMASWGESIKSFCTSVAIGMTLLGVIPVNTAAIESIGTLAGAILTITANSILEGIRQFLGLNEGDKTAVQEFAEDMASMGPALAKFAQDTAGITNIDDTLKCAKAIEALANTSASLKKIPPNWFTALVGRTQGLDEFAQELAGSVFGLTAFATMSAAIAALGATEDMKNVAEAIEAIVTVANKLPKRGGVLQQVIGEVQSLPSFASELAKAIPDIAEFANAAPQIAEKAEDIKSAAAAIQAIVDVANSLKPEEAEYGWGAYYQNAQTLGEFLEAFGGTADTIISVGGQELIHVNDSKEGITQQLATFAETFHTLKEQGKFDGITDATTILTDLARIGNTLSTEEKSFQALFGLVSYEITEKSGLAVLAAEMPGVTTALSQFITTIGADDISILQKGVDVLHLLAETEQILHSVFEKDFENDYGGVSLTYLVDELIGANTSSEDALQLDELAELFKAFNGIDFTGVNGFAEWAKNSAGKEEWINEGKSIIAAMAGTLQTASDLILPTASDVTTTRMAEEFAKDVHIGKFKTVGMQFAQGLADGIMENIRAVEASAATLSERTIQTMRRVLRINSPSRVMRKIGEYTGEGFVLGVNDWVRASGTAGEDLATSMSESAANVLGYISALLNGDLVVDMTIRPVLDFTNLNSDLGSLSGMLSQRQALLAEANINAIGQHEEVAELIDVSWRILREIQNGRDLYLDGKVLARTMDRRLGRMEGNL